MTSKKDTDNSTSSLTDGEKLQTKSNFDYAQAINDATVEDIVAILEEGENENENGADGVTDGSKKEGIDNITTFQKLRSIFRALNSATAEFTMLATKVARPDEFYSKNGIYAATLSIYLSNLGEVLAGDRFAEDREKLGEGNNQEKRSFDIFKIYEESDKILDIICTAALGVFFSKIPELVDISEDRFFDELKNLLPGKQLQVALKAHKEAGGLWLGAAGGGNVIDASKEFKKVGEKSSQ
jgi:hypothetical protein